MLKNLKFSHKMMIIPVVVLIVLLVLFFVARYFDNRNKELLTQIESGFVPALEWAYQLESTLNAIQRSLQDAAAAMDEEELQRGDQLAADFLELLKTGNHLPEVISHDLEGWENRFQNYYTQAREASVYLLDGGALTEETVQSLEELNVEYNRLKNTTQFKVTQAREEVSMAFAATLKNNQRSSQFMGAIILGCAFLLGGATLFLSRSVTKPLQQVIEVAHELARGNTAVTISVDSNDEIGSLAHVFEGLIYTTKELAKAATAIGNGDYSVPVNIRSKDDVLGNALSVMKANLIANSTALEAQNWMKTGLTELNVTLRGEQDLVELAQKSIRFLSQYVDAQIGAICIANDDQVLRLVGSYAYSERKGNHTIFRPGEGLIGQAALEKEPLIFSHIPEDYIKIRSQLGETVPGYILVLPFLYEGEVKGVIELGAVHAFDDIQMDFLKQAGESLAIAFHSTQSRIQMRKLFEETSRQSAVLQTQQEELRRTNEELETQTQSLKRSEAELQAQQEELRQTNEELEEQTQLLERQKRELGKKNRELIHTRLLIEQKAKDLEISSKYKSEFLANMSHELRTPLNSLLILSKLLAENKQGNLTEKQIQYADTVHKAGSDLLGLINDVLDLSKIEAGKMSLNLEDMNLKHLTSYIEQHFNHIVEQKRLHLRVELQEGLPDSLHTDRQRVEQVLKNLISNAIKFTHQGEIRIRISRPPEHVDLSHSGLMPHETIALSVSDTGIGIPATKQRLIFEAFQQADGKTNRKYGGTGLGLSISRELAKLLGGEIQLHSQEGEGSTFTLYLPEVLHLDLSEEQIIARSPADHAMGPRSDRPTGPNAANLSNPAHSPQDGETPGVETIRDDRHEEIAEDDQFLLIIEDDPKFASILFELAREHGFKGLVAGDGAAGLQLAYQYTPAAIMLDIGLPDTSGWAVMEKLKKNPETRHIPVHFITAYDQPMNAMKMGAIGYLTKPVNMEQLQEVFRKIEATLSRGLKKLLIVEDDDLIRSGMVELLHGNDIEISTVATGAETYNRLQSETYDCIVLDLGLSDISGFELLKKIHADSGVSSLPIIVYTGKELTKEEEITLKKHAESIIIKGVKSLERLLDEVALFLHRVEADLPEKQRKKLRMIHDKEKVLADRTILMVDDDMRNVFALSSALEEKGIHVLVAENGKEALDMLAIHTEIELVLMDIMMPEMDGYETMQEIRDREHLQSLPIIALTAKAMKGDRQKCIDAGANDYLSKPVDIDKLLSLLRVWLY